MLYKIGSSELGSALEDEILGIVFHFYCIHLLPLVGLDLSDGGPWIYQAGLRDATVLNCSTNIQHKKIIKNLVLIGDPSSVFEDLCTALRVPLCQLSRLGFPGALLPTGDTLPTSLKLWLVFPRSSVKSRL